MTDGETWDVPAIGRALAGLEAGRDTGCRRVLEAAVAITLELYLEHQIMRGTFQSAMDDTKFRAVDLLNFVTGDVIELTDAWSASLHVESPPNWFDVVRAQRQHVFLVVPHDLKPLPPPQHRVTVVEKQPLRAVVGLGPFSVAGTLYIPSDRQGTLSDVEHDPTGRYFIPITEAEVRSQYHPRWRVNADLLLFNRAAMTYVHKLT